ncbi:hypothetical protein [Hominifimenecus sp. rT4P-3]|uniref:hypothetical protein n=1 Tax=Hominifimenecus sp. rT4P-3 TaxID=3242979 RepID=UPI003DA3531B
MMIITSRTQEGKPLSEERMRQVSLTENPQIDRLLQRVLMRINQEAEQSGAKESCDLYPGIH